ncbi:MAG TPA: ABC transporter substrate-binding protein [Bradyrhizobium sp.]|jgi:putative ABC transport system substrate-binding protein|nr:ABC transporter substrate-binding protein [Bradyrhizobium sp.]
MRRREFITLLGGAAATCPLAARAQQPRRLPTIGFLGAGTSSVWSQWTAAFVQRLRELGWVEGRTVTIEYRWAEGRPERYSEIATEFARLKVDVIATVGSAVPAAMQVTSTIPIVFAIAVDPFGTGMVASLAKPGGNVEVAEVQATAHKLGIEIEMLEIRRAEDIVPAFDKPKSGMQAIYVCPDALINTNIARINTLALGARLPTIHAFRDFLETGGFMSYGAKNSDLFRRAADLVDKILKGAKPADLPVEQPTTFELVVNLTTAKALSITIPEAFLLRADEVIE